MMGKKAILEKDLLVSAPCQVAGFFKSIDKSFLKEHCYKQISTKELVFNWEKTEFSVSQADWCYNFYFVEKLLIFLEDLGFYYLFFFPKKPAPFLIKIVGDKGENGLWWAVAPQVKELGK